MEQNRTPNAAQPQQQRPMAQQPVAQPQQRPMAQQPMGQPQQRPMAQQPMGQPQQRPMAQQPMAQPQQQRPMAQQPMGQPQQRPMAQQPMGQPQQRPMAQQPMGQPQQRPMAQQPMGEAQQGVEKQLVVRMFLPDMQLLKATAKQISATPNIKLGLYGQAGEVLVAISARARTTMAATELTENAAAQFEAAMGDSVYGRGKAALGAAVVEEMTQDEATLSVADPETGALMEPELRPVRDADKVYDFGQDSFNNARMADKIADAALMDDEESADPIQLSADRSFAVRKCTKTDFGVAIAGENGEQMVCASVVYGKFVYVRCIRTAPDAAKSAALTVLDMIRRLTLGMPIPYARAFKAGQEIDWNEPTQQKGSSKTAARSGGSKGGAKGGGKGLIVPMILLALVAAALCVAIWYVVTTFIIKDEGSVPAAGGTSTSDIVYSDIASTPAGDAGASAPVGSTPAASTPASAAASVPAGNAGTGEPVVHPFS